MSDRIRSMQIGVDIVCKLEAELRACKREKREMWKAMNRVCAWNDRRDMCHKRRGDGPCVKCTLRNCPLLKKEDAK